jgi:predicted permease
LLRELLRRLHYLLNRRRFDDELADEMAFHREMAEKGGGVPLGNALRHREDAREAWGFMWLDRLGQDLRYTFRAMRSSPGFTAVAVIVLSIGIGATVAVFSAFNNVVFHPLPVRDPDSLVRFERQSKDRTATAIPYPAVVFYREHARTLSAVLALTSSPVSLEDGDESVETFFVTSNFFDELGAAPAHGRMLSVNDGRTDAPPVVVLGHGFWVSHFGANPSVVGTSVRLNGRAVTIVGVAARESTGLAVETPALWAAIEHHGDIVHGSQILTDFSGQNGGVTMFGRLGPGSSPRAAEDELTRLAAELRREHPADIWEDERLSSDPGGYPPPLLGATTAFAVVGVLAVLILAVACGNLGSLLLARGASRQREMALRTAIGAGTGRLVRQLFTESLTLASFGCAGGLLLGSLVFKGLMVWTSAPPWFDSTPDWRVVTFATVMGLLTSLIFCLAPALQVARQKPRRSRTTFTKSFLIGVQVASSCVLLIVGGLLVRAFERAVTRDPGFEYEHVIVVQPSLLEHGYSPVQARAYIRDLSERIRSLSGIEDVSVTSTPPLGGLKIIGRSNIDGRPFDMYIHQVDPRYLATMKIPLLAGRNLMEGDDRGVIVSASLASRYWPNRDPLGQPVSIKIGAEAFDVVGIAGNARSLALGDPDTVEVYRLAREADQPGLAVVARASAPAETLVAAVKASANGMDPAFKPRVHLLKDRFREQVGDIQQVAVAVSVLGFVALAVACLGVIGLVAYAVAARTKEIGIRVALGAMPHHVVRSVIRQFQRTVMGGLAGGILGAFGLAQFLRRELYGVSTIDPAAYAGAILLFLVAIGLAASWPVRRALRVDPLVALRTD